MRDQPITEKRGTGSSRRPASPPPPSSRSATKAREIRIKSYLLPLKGAGLPRVGLPPPGPASPALPVSRDTTADHLPRLKGRFTTSRRWFWGSPSIPGNPGNGLPRGAGQHGARKPEVLPVENPGADPPDALTLSGPKGNSFGPPAVRRPPRRRYRRGGSRYGWNPNLRARSHGERRGPVLTPAGRGGPLRDERDHHQQGDRALNAPYEAGDPVHRIGKSDRIPSQHQPPATLRGRAGTGADPAQIPLNDRASDF